jgi:hypothetical protein
MALGTFESHVLQDFLLAQGPQKGPFVEVKRPFGTPNDAILTQFGTETGDSEGNRSVPGAPTLSSSHLETPA